MPQAKKQDARWESVPLSLIVDDYQIVDDHTFDQKDFIKRVADSPNCPKSACPSPERYMQAYEGGYDAVFVVTLSEKLSGSYNSAVLGKQLFEKEHPETKVHVINSRSASVGQTLIALKAEELAQTSASFDEIVTQVERFRDGMNTYFVLNNLETLRKNGRLSNLKAVIASVLNIKPVMGATPEGTICQLEQVRGIKRAHERMADIVVKEAKDPESKILGISHCNCPSHAEDVKKIILSKLKFKDCIILDTAGVSTMYANDGGIIVTL
jgi:DegV family protein with EDD domain